MFYVYRLTAVHSAGLGSFIRYCDRKADADLATRHLTRTGWQVEAERVEVPDESVRVRLRANLLFSTTHPVATHESIMAAIEAQLEGRPVSWPASAGCVDLPAVGA